MLTTEERDVIRLAKSADFQMPPLSEHPLEWWYEKAVAHLQALGLSLRSIIEDVKEATLLDRHSVTYWRVWLCGAGVIERLREVGFTLTLQPDDQVLIAWGEELHQALYAEATGATVPTVLLERYAEVNQ